MSLCCVESDGKEIRGVMWRIFGVTGYAQMIDLSCQEFHEPLFLSTSVLHLPCGNEKMDGELA